MAHFKDEYDDIYEQYENSGFEFVYKNKRLGKSKTIFKEEVDGIDISKRNNDDIPLFVKCGSCGIYMDFEMGPNDDLDGWWKCPDCGARVKERTVYRHLEDENEAFMESFAVDDIPEYCQECDGPYPDCIPSCKLFDD